MTSSRANKPERAGNEREPFMSRGALVTLVLLVAAVIGGMFYWKHQQRTQAEMEAIRAPAALLSHSMIYQSNRAYIDEICREAHAEAFAKAYRPGSFFSPSEWDEQVYIEEVVALAARRARADERHDVADGLPGNHP